MKAQALKGYLRDWIPPALLRAYRAHQGNSLRFSGRYESWDQARALSSGYDSSSILGKAKDAALMVKRGEAIFERDTVIFTEPDYSFPVLATILRVAESKGGEVTVLDFGGALGSSYRQFKAFGGSPRRLTWMIVEQSGFVNCGREYFEDDELRFYASVAEAVAAQRPDVVLLSGVLQYLEAPYDLLIQLAAQRQAHVIVDRTPCSEAVDDVLTIQFVPSSIYEASYPCWIFSRDRLLAMLTHAHKSVASFREASGPWSADRLPFAFCGFILEPRALSDGARLPA